MARSGSIYVYNICLMRSTEAISSNLESWSVLDSLNLLARAVVLLDYPVSVFKHQVIGKRKQKGCAVVKSSVSF